MCLMSFNKYRWNSVLIVFKVMKKHKINQLEVPFLNLRKEKLIKPLFL